MSDRHDYLIECSRTAREELLFRIKHRDAWLKLQLFVQAVLWALSHGIKLGGAEASTPVPLALALALPIGLVLAGLYFVEDGLIHRLSQYVASLSDIENKLSNNQCKIVCWDASAPLRGYAKGVTLVIRQIAQIAAFLIIPGYLAIFYHQQNTLTGWLFGIQIIIAVLIVSLIVIVHRDRT